MKTFTFLPSSMNTTPDDFSFPYQTCSTELFLLDDENNIKTQEIPF